MKMAVCIKQVPATESKIKPSSDGKEIDRAGLSYVVNPYDEFGVEEALRIKERFNEGSVTIVTIGPERATEALRTCLALGADEAIHIKDDCLEGGDAYAAAVVLTASLKKDNYDIIFFGKQAVDDDNGAVGIHVAEFMGLPHVAVINKLDLFPEEGRAVASRQIEGATEMVEIKLPAVFTCQKGLNEPRYASLPGIMKAKQKPLTTLSLDDLGVDEEAAGAKGAKLCVDHIEAPGVRSTGKILDKDPAESVEELVRLLRDEAKLL